MPYKDPIEKRRAWRKWYQKMKSDPVRYKLHLKKHREKRKKNIKHYHEWERKSYWKNREKNLKRGRRYKEKERLKILKHYSGDPPRCACCGEKELAFLTIDHIKGGGNKHKKRIGKGILFYRWLKRNNYPKGFQVLCMNCNWGKYIKGVCPHQLKQ